MRQQLASLLLVVCMLALLLSACAGGSTTSSSSGGMNQPGLASGNSYINCPSSTNTTTARAETGKITLTVSGWSSTTAEDTLVQKNLRTFARLHPTIKIIWSPISSDYTTKMRANVASGTVPDVFYLQPSMSSEYISTGKLLNLAPYMAEAGVKASDYYPSLISPFSCASGQVYGLPKDWNTLGVYYNKSLFKQAGLAFPTSGWTWSNFQQDAAKLTKNAGTTRAVYGTVLSADLSRWGAILLQSGGSVLNTAGTEATFNNTAGVKALEYYASFFKHKTGALATSVGAAWNGDAFGQQRAAMVLEGSWLTPYLRETYANVNYGVAPLPTSNSGMRANLSYTNAWSAYSGTQHAYAAWQLIQYMTGPTVQTSQLDTGYMLPTIKSLSNASYFQSHPDFKVLFEAGAYSYADYYGPQDAMIHTMVANAIEEVLLNRESAQTALNNAALQVDAQLQEE